MSSAPCILLSLPSTQELLVMSALATPEPAHILAQRCHRYWVLKAEPNL